MISKSEKVAELFGRGYNCAQAVFCSFCDNYGFDVAVAEKIACGLGSGVRNAEVCGAVSGTVLVIGLKYGYDKKVCNAKTEEITAKFRARNQHIVCRNILGCDIATLEGREVAIKANLFKTVCLDMVVSAVDILDNLGY